ncbi:MAG: GldG family protein [Defluviitaleaceae bacterium]|nr:GldG family protein [Defluviitaleaceae bacterium]
MFGKLKILREKRFRYGTFSTAMMLFAVVLFVLVNLVAGEFDRTWDLTDEQLFTLSPQSHRFLETLNQDVTITLIAPTGTEDPLLTALLEEYASANARISVGSRDPLISPGFVQQFSAELDGAMPNQSIIVQSGTQHRVITPDMMVTLQHNQWGHPIGIASVNFERQITTSIHTVTQGEVATVYKVLGSGETPLDPAFISFLEAENFIVRGIDAITIIRDGIPADADILLLSTPQWDWPADKADRILAFLEDEGLAFMVIDPQFGMRMPNFDRVLAAYGVRVSDYIVMETDPRQHVVLPMFVIPQLMPHEVNLPLAAAGRMTLLTRFSGAVELTGILRTTTTIEPILFTSSNAFGRIDLHLESPLFHPDYDYDGGPFVLAVAITDSVFAGRSMETRIVVVGSGDIWSPAPREMVGDNNFLFAASALRWLTGQGPGLFIHTRTPPGINPLMLNQLQANMIAGFSMGLLPLATLAVGIFIWYRRRHS